MKNFCYGLFILCFATVFFVASGDCRAADGLFFAGGDVAGIHYGKKIIALTFDDGPGATTAEVLRLLKEYNAHATFFVLGASISTPKGAGLLKKISSDGHEIGNHTYSHINFYSYKKSDRENLLLKEITDTERLIERIVGAKPSFLRLPNGYNAKWSREAAGKAGYIMVNWTFGCDWMGKSDEETTRLYITEGIKPGGILLFHDGGGKLRTKTINALKAVLEKISKEGYEVVTVGDMLRMNLYGQGGNRTHTGP